MKKEKMRVETNVDAYVESSEIVKATIKMFRKHFNVDAIDGIDDKGRMYEWAEYATSHTWTTKEDRGEPTQEQKEILKAVELLRKLEKEL